MPVPALIPSLGPFFRCVPPIGIRPAKALRSLRTVEKSAGDDETRPRLMAMMPLDWDLAYCQFSQQRTEALNCPGSVKRD